MSLFTDEIKLSNDLAKIHAGKSKALTTTDYDLHRLPFAFPEGLEDLWIGNATINVLESRLPSTLKKLDLHGSQIAEVIDQLPVRLEEFITSRDMRELPRLPNGLKRLELYRLLYINYLYPLPDDLEELIIRDCNVLARLPPLPPKLKKLYIRRCTLLRRLPRLPEGLEVLDIAESSIRSIPDLPSTVNFINITETMITELPPLPSSLTRLLAIESSLEELPPLPEGLKQLNLTESRFIDRLPPLPSTLEELAIGVNARIKTIPPLPKHLRVLSLHNTLEITELPELPPKLEMLNMSDSNVYTIPTIPSTLRQLHISGCGNLLIQRKRGETIQEYNERFEEIRSKARQEKKAKEIKKELYARVMYHPNVLHKIIRYIPENEDPMTYFENEDFKMKLMNLDI